MMIHSIGKVRSKSLILICLIAIFASIGFALVTGVINVHSAGMACQTSSPASHAYTITVCFTEPVDGATLSGLQMVTATATSTGASPGARSLVFYADGQYLLTDYQAPYTFTLPTGRWMDGNHTLQVEALMKDGFTSQRTSTVLTFQNNVTQLPVNTHSFTPSSGSAPQPGQPFVLAAVGDGAGGEVSANNVVSLITSWNPNLFLYLGDVYEKGSSTEFQNYYGLSSVFSRFRSITNPVIGNHEYENGVAPGYFDYWDNVPNYYSYDAAGWHFIALNSNCGLLHNCAAGAAQYQWLVSDLAAHSNACTIAYFHHPRYNLGPEGDSPILSDIWSLLAQRGVDIILNGHDHNYQRWKPLNGNGVSSPTGMTQFVVGSGGHGIQGFIRADNRAAIGFDTSPNTFGALRMELNSSGTSYQFINYEGVVLDSGAIACSGAQADTASPGTPGNLTATIFSSSRVDLAWTGSTDNTGVSGYDIYRNGTLLASLGVVNGYSDMSVALGASYQYQVQARDSAGNLSVLSNTATATLPALLFSDGFEGGNLSAWTGITNVAVQQTDHYAGTNAARVSSTGAAPSFAFKQLSAAQTDLYYATTFKIISQGASSAYLQRFRTTANGAILGVYVSSTGKLSYRNELTATANTSTTSVTPNVWHQLQTHVRINGTSSQIEIWLDDTQVTALSKADSFGTTAIGRIQLGDSQSADIYTIAFDEVAVTTSFINTRDSQAPTSPGSLTANARAANIVDLSWAAASDNISVTGYDVYRNGDLLATIPPATTYTDTPVSPAFTYQYELRARDAAGNISEPGTPATITTPSDSMPPGITLTGPVDGAVVNANVMLSADASDDVALGYVEFMVNGVVVGSVEDAPYELLWDSTSVADGEVTLSARAVDGSSNSTLAGSRTITVDNLGGDTTAPSVPGNFSANTVSSSRIDLNWNASTDNVAVTGYNLYRDGALLVSLGTVTSYSDTGLALGTTYQYQVQARDGQANVSALTTTVSATTPGLLFSDGFESGDASAWTNAGLTVQQQDVLEGLDAARVTSTAGTASYAYKQLGTPQADLYYATWFKLVSQGSNSVYLLRFRTATNGAILGVFVSSTGKLGYRNDVSSSVITSTTGVSRNTWHQLQVHVLVNGAAGQTEIRLDGALVSALSKTESLGATPVGRVQLGESGTGNNYDVFFDEVVLDGSFIRSPAAPYTLIGSGPSGLTNSTSASFTFSATAPDATFECSLDGAAFSACISPQAYSGLGDATHTFAVRATDSSGNVDATPARRTWTADTLAPAIMSVIPVDGATDLALTTNVDATFSEAINPASLTSANFTLTRQDGTTALAATVTYDANTRKASLHPASPLAYLTTYTATLKGGAGGPADLTGNPMGADRVWTFTTTAPDSTPPVVTLTAPADGASVGGRVTLTADASDNMGIDHVEFFVNGTSVGSAASSPYRVTWDSTSSPNGPVTVTAQAVDTSANATLSAGSALTIANDLTPPSVPDALSANNVNSGQITLTWTVSSDDVAVTGYDIFRNGALLVSIGALNSYTDTTIAPSTSYLYRVRARDAAGNVSDLSLVVAVASAGVLFSDRFETGDLSRWSAVSGLVVQTQEAYAGVYGARAVSNGPVANAYKQFTSGQTDLFFKTRFKILSADPSNAIYLQRFRTAATMSLVGVFVSSTGKLGYRNDVAGTSNINGPSISRNVWHEVQTHVRINDTASLVEVWLDGARLDGLSRSEALGTAPIGRLQLGDSTAGHTYDIAFDDVAAALSFINPGDTTLPGTPADLTATASSASQVDLAWSAASDNIGIAGYNIYRNGALLAVAGPATSYSDTTALPLTTYQYQVRARDAAENISAASNQATASTPTDTIPPTVSISAPVAGAFIGRTVTLVAAASDNVAVDHVDFLVNGNLVGRAAAAPYMITWDSTLLPDSPVTITARAVDTFSNAATSAGVVAQVDNTAPAPATVLVNSSLIQTASSLDLFNLATRSSWYFDPATGILLIKVRGSAASGGAQDIWISFSDANLPPPPTLTPTLTLTPTPTLTLTPTPSNTRTPTSTRTATETRTPTLTRTLTDTQTPSSTRTPTITRTPNNGSFTRTPTPTAAPVISPIPTSTPAPAPTITPTFSVNPTSTSVPTSTDMPTLSPSFTPTETPTETQTPDGPISQSGELAQKWIAALYGVFIK